MTSTVQIPVIGPVNKAKLAGVTIGGFAVSGYLIYRYVKKSKTAAAAANATSAAAVSGYGYGTGGSIEGSPEPAGYYGYGTGYGYGSSGGFNATGYYGYGVPEPQTVALTTNAQWEQAAIAQLTGEDYSAQTVSAALSNYTEGLAVTPAQEGIINSAIGVEGYPPVPGTNGYPPSIKTMTGTPVLVPDVIGMRGAKAKTALTNAGFKTFQAPTPPKGKSSTVKSQTPRAGTTAAYGSTVSMVLTIS